MTTLTIILAGFVTLTIAIIVYFFIIKSIESDRKYDAEIAKIYGRKR